MSRSLPVARVVCAAASGGGGPATPLRDFDSLDDLQRQHDAWAAKVAFGRTLRRTSVRVVER